MDAKDKLWHSLLMGISKDSSPWSDDLPGLTASELESSLRLLAQLQHRLPGPVLNTARDWFQERMQSFAPPPGSRQLDPAALAPAMRLLGMGQEE